LQRDTRCYSDSDRAALIDVIALWFADGHSGESDLEGLRQLGIHRFESFVRFEIAPQLAEDSRALSPLHTLCVIQAVWMGYMLDTYAMPVVTANTGFLLSLCMVVWMTMVWLPLALVSLRVGTRAGDVVQAHCCCGSHARCGTLMVYLVGVAVVLGLNFINWVGVFAAPNPNMWNKQYFTSVSSNSSNGTAWTSPRNSDGFQDDPIARQAMKWQLFLLSMCAVLFASQKLGKWT
jgi:hypothetical protein